MKRFILLLQLILLISTTTLAQSMYGDQVNFDVKMKYVYSLEEALKLAKEKKKLIFFNCFADWAVPCHAMNKKVFSDQEFSNWMDDNFVNLFIDISKPAGKPLARKYDVKMMAHYLVLDANGEIVHRIVGGGEIEDFKKDLSLALNPKTSLRGMNAAYTKGQRDFKFLRSYMDVLAKAEAGEVLLKVRDEAFPKMKKKDWSKAANWNLFRSKINSIDDEYFNFLIDNKKTFLKENKRESLDHEIIGQFEQTIYPYVMGDKPFDADKFLDIMLKIQRSDLSNAETLMSFYDFAKARGEGNMEKMTNILSKDGTKWNPNLLRNVDLSLEKFKGLAPADKAVLTAYWQKRADSFKSSTGNHYRNAIKRLNTTTGISFKELSLDEAKELAAKEGKLIFLDCFTTWCGPCKWLDANTFVDKSVGSYFNDNYISIKIDMEKGEGIELRKKLEVNAFPTLFLLDSQGNIVHKMVGALNAEKLLNEVKSVKFPKS